MLDRVYDIRTIRCQRTIWCHSGACMEADSQRLKQTANLDRRVPLLCRSGDRMGPGLAACVCARVSQVWFHSSAAKAVTELNACGQKRQSFSTYSYLSDYHREAVKTYSNLLVDFSPFHCDFIARNYVYCVISTLRRTKRKLKKKRKRRKKEKKKEKKKKEKKKKKKRERDSGKTTYKTKQTNE